MKYGCVAALAACALLAPALAAAQPAPAASSAVTMPDASARFRIEGRGSFVIVDKRGVPDALRTGASVGVMVKRWGPLALAADAVGVFGFSEKIGHSYRFGSNVEAEWVLPSIGASVYAGSGLHYFVSRAEEDRKGLLLRWTAGFRVFTSGRVYVGFEPFALERVPNGKGIQTPVRSRWAWELTFLSLGYRP